MANQHLGLIALLVRDYDEAKAYYCDVLGFTLIEDTRMDEAKRWVVVAPPGSSETRLLLAKAATPAQAEHIGNQGGGRVFLFLHTDDFWSDFRRMQSKGVRFREEPRSEPYGTVVVFEDLYGNAWDMIERNPNG
jgi:lactoylglutathione lyase